jgi:two-component system sensor histidine kinase LytS
LEFTVDIDECVLEHPIPPFTIQPLVENAIVHGIKNINRTGIIQVRIKEEIDCEQRHARITVEDNGVGLETAHRDGQEDHAGLALRNIEQRLSYHYGRERPLEIESNQGIGTKISFWVR